MAGHRYWRLTGLSTQGDKSNLALTEVELLNNSSLVNSSLTTVSNTQPLVGTLDLLTDGVHNPTGPVDENYDKVALHLRGEGVNGGQVFTDESTKANIASFVGGVTTSTDQHKFGLSSIHFTDNSQYIYFPTDTTTAFRRDDFTIEGFIYLTTYPTKSGVIYDTLPLNGDGARPNSLAFYVTTTGRLEFYSKQQAFATSSNIISLNAQTHFALTRENGVFKTWIDGVPGSTLNLDLDDTLGGRVISTIGNVPGSSGFSLTGYLDEFRVTKGLARYNKNFIPPTAQFPNKRPPTTVFKNSDLGNLALSWDLSVDTPVTDIGFGTPEKQSEFLLSAVLQYSDDNTNWSTQRVYAAPKWPGSYSLTLSDYSGNYWDRNPYSNTSDDGTISCPAAQSLVSSSVYKSSGIHQFEVKFINGSSDYRDQVNFLLVGVSTTASTSDYVPYDKEFYGINSDNTTAYENGVTASVGSHFFSNDVVGFVADFTAGSLDVYINGVLITRLTSTGLMGKAVSPRLGDTSGYRSRKTQCILKTSNFDFPVSGSDNWALPSSIVIDKKIFRVLSTSVDQVYFPKAYATKGNLIPKDYTVIAGGNFFDPGKGSIIGNVKNSSLTITAEDLALPNLLFASHFNDDEGAISFVDEKNHKIINYGDCTIVRSSAANINSARSSILHVKGGSGNGIRVPIASLADPLNLSTGDFTIRTWYYLKEDAIPGRYGIFSWGGGYNYSYANIRLDMRTNTSVAISLRTQNAGEGINDLAAYQEIPNSFPGKSQWVHLAITREGPLIRLWVNGSKKYEVSTTYPIHDSFNLTGIDIGSAGYDARIAPAPSDGADAYFDDFQIFNTCLYKADFTPDVTKEFSLSRSGFPVKRKVQLFRETDGLLIRQVWSDPLTGHYEFRSLNKNYTYTVIAYDYTNMYRAAIINGKKAI